jgi:hypothetical protein
MLRPLGVTDSRELPVESVTSVETGATALTEQHRSGLGPFLLFYVSDLFDVGHGRFSPWGASRLVEAVQSVNTKT